MDYSDQPKRQKASILFTNGLIILAILSSLLGVQASSLPHNPSLSERTFSQGERAVAVLTAPNHDVVGTIVFQQASHSTVIVMGEIRNLSPKALHGMHVHEYGNLTDPINQCNSAGAHFNPYHTNHGGLDTSKPRHVGDLGNIYANDAGVASFTIKGPDMRLHGPLGIVGRAIVVHAGEDDLGKKGDAGSLANGNSGERVACGIIGIGS